MTTEWTGGDEVGHQPDEDPGEVPNGSSAVEKDIRIENQAAMHFASRIVASRMDYLERSDEAIVEELNKWMSKFKRGVPRGEIPKD